MFSINIHQSIGFYENNLFLRIYEINRPCLLSCARPCVYLTLASKNFTFSRKLYSEGSRIGGLFELLENCVCVFWYEGYLVIHKIYLFLVHNLRRVARSSTKKYDLEAYLFIYSIVRKVFSCQNGDV